MSSVEKFLNMILKYQNEAQDSLKNVQEKRSQINQLILNKMNKSIKFQHKALEKDNLFQQYNINYLQKKAFKYFDLCLIDINTFDDDQLLEAYDIYCTAELILKSNIKYFSYLLQAFKKNKVKVFIDIRLVLQMLLYGWTFENLKIEDVSTVLGMTIKKNSLNNQKNIYTEEIKALAEYYNSNGKLISFFEKNISEAEYDNYINHFANDLKSLCFIYTDYVIFRQDQVEPTYSKMLASLLNYFISLNKTELNQLHQLAKKSNCVEKNSFRSAILPQEALEYVKQYYQNGYFNQFPEDLKTFQKYLEACPITEIEKNYLNQLLTNIIEDEIRPFLKGNDLNKYLKICQIIHYLDYNSKDYQNIMEERNSLRELIALSKENISLEDQEILNNEKDEIMQRLQNYIDKYFYEGCNLILLNSPNEMFFIEEDILDDWPNLYPSLSNGLKKLQENDLELNLLPAIKGIDFPLYVRHSENIDLYLVEVCLGTFVLVGVNLPNQKNRFILNRVFKYREALIQYQNYLLNNLTRKKLLQWESLSVQQLIR